MMKWRGYPVILDSNTGRFDRDGGTKTISNNDVCLKGSPGSLTLIGHDGGRRGCPTKQPPEKTEKD